MMTKAESIPQPDLECFTGHELSTGDRFYTGMLPEDLVLTGEPFEALWALHPEERPTVQIFRSVLAPRWQQAYGASYRFSKQQAAARPVPDILQPFLTWAQANVSAALNGLLLNWYDGSQCHHIGPHRDDTRDLVPGSPIVTVSLGEERLFRFSLHRKMQAVQRYDVPVRAGSVLVIPWATNKVWKHSVPHLVRYSARRISITLRAYTTAMP